MEVTSAFGRKYPVPPKTNKRYCPKHLVISDGRNKGAYIPVPDFAQPPCLGPPKSVAIHMPSAERLLREKVDDLMPYHRTLVKMEEKPICMRLPFRPNNFTSCGGMKIDLRENIRTIMNTSTCPSDYMGERPAKLPEFTLVVRWPHNNVIPSFTPAVAFSILQRYGTIRHMAKWRSSPNAMIVVYQSPYPALRVMECTPLQIGKSKMIVDWYFTHMKGQANQQALTKKIPPERVHETYSEATLKKMQFLKTQYYVAGRLKSMCSKMSYQREDFVP